MQMSGEHTISAPRHEVWEALHDTEILKSCIRGCERLERTGDNTMAATVVAKVGPVKATFDANIEIADEVAPERYTLRGEGKGGVAGFAKGSATVTLAEAEGGAATVLSYTTDATVGGKLAQLGSRLVDTTARRYAAEFFDAFAARLRGDVPVAGTAVPVADGEAPAETFEGDVGERLDEERIEEGVFEVEAAAPGSPIAPPHAEDRLGDALDQASASRSWGGAFFWGVLALLAVIVALYLVS